MAAYWPFLADQSIYKCKAKGKSSILKIDYDKKTLAWQGKTYKIARELTSDECAKFGWHVEGSSGAGDFCTATQGVADFAVAGIDLDCDLKR